MKEYKTKISDTANLNIRLDYFINKIMTLKFYKGNQIDKREVYYSR